MGHFLDNHRIKHLYFLIYVDKKLTYINLCQVTVSIRYCLALRRKVATTFCLSRVVKQILQHQKPGYSKENYTVLEN